MELVQRDGCKLNVGAYVLASHINVLALYLFRFEYFVPEHKIFIAIEVNKV